MEQDEGSVRQTILNRSLAEIQEREEDVEPCVICLERVSEPATAFPCRHNNFDYLCLASWLEQQRSCPLCKSDVKSIDYLDHKGNQHRYELPEKVENDGSNILLESRTSRPPFYQSRRGQFRDSRNSRRQQPPARSPISPSSALLRRRNVYRQQLFSLHVGSNRLSAYNELTPQRISGSPALVSRARTWIRRELEVFSFLDPTSDSSSSTPPRPASLRTISNSEFLLEYIIAILKTVDIRGSTGHAQDMLADFIGRENSRLFLHELESWLRSPYESLEAWDRHVQYPNTSARGASQDTRVQERKRGRNSNGAEEAGMSDARKRRRALDRYVPE